MSKLKSRIRGFRLSSEITLFRMARLIGVTSAKLSQFECGNDGLNIDAVEKLIDIIGAPQSEWISVDDWEKVDCEPVLVFYSHITDLGMFTGVDKAYWNADVNCWSGFGLNNVFSDGAQVRYAQPLPKPPKQ